MKLTLDEFHELCERFGIDADVCGDESEKPEDIQYCKALLIRALEDWDEKHPWREVFAAHKFDLGAVYKVTATDDFEWKSFFLRFMNSNESQATMRIDIPSLEVEIGVLQPPSPPELFNTPPT